MVEMLKELPKIRAMYDMAKELTKSPVPMVQDNAVLVLALLQDLRNHVDPEHFKNIVDYE